MKNPLYAERYWSDMTDMYVAQILNEKPALEKAGMLTAITEKKDEALAASKAALAERKKGRLGQVVPIKNGVAGLVLLLDNTLFFNPDFVIDPGPSLHVYVTHAVDPRDTAFPDKSSIDLGRLQTPYGAQSYTLPQNIGSDGLRTVVFYDVMLKRLFAFGQLQEQ